MTQFESMKMTDPKIWVSTTRKDKPFSPSAGAILEGESGSVTALWLPRSKGLQCSKGDANTVEGRPGEPEKPGL